MTNLPKPLPPPEFSNSPQVEFNRNEFESAVWSKGYEVIREKAISCPCGTLGHPDTSCRYCNGVGLLFIDPVLDRVLMTSINSESKYKEWSMDKSGTVSMTLRDNTVPISFYDRITIKDCYSYLSENRSLNNDDFVWLTFKPKRILSVHILDSLGVPTEVGSDKYSIDLENPYILVIDPEINPSNGLISVYYEHEVQYYVIDIPHDMRSSNVTDANGNLNKIDLPLNVICRRGNQFIGERQIYGSD